MEGDEFGTLVGPTWTRIEADGEKRFGVLAEKKHLSRFGRVHGGVLLWLADKSLSLKAGKVSGATQIATIQLDTQFVGIVPAHSFIEVRSEVTRKTGSLVFVTGRLMVGETIVASASGIWKYRI